MQILSQNLSILKNSFIDTLNQFHTKCFSYFKLQGVGGAFGNCIKCRQKQKQDKKDQSL